MQTKHTLITSAAVAALSIGTHASAQFFPFPPSPPRAEAARSAMVDHFRTFCADEEALFKSRIAFMEAKLDLKPGQRDSWNAFAADARAAGMPIRRLCQDIPAKPPADIVSDFDRREKGLSAALETDRALRAAVEKLLVTLEPDQQRVLRDSLLPPLPPGPLGPTP